MSTTTPPAGGGSAMPIVGPWVAVWKRRLAAAVAQHNADNPDNLVAIPGGFDPNTWLWGRYARELAQSYKRALGVKKPDGRLDGTLRALLRQVVPWTPKIIDVRAGGYGFPEPKPWGYVRSKAPILTGHYTGGRSTFQAYARYHQDGHGWAYLAYHLGVDFDGTIYVVNDPRDVTWHARGLNFASVGLVFNGDAAGPNDAQRKTLEWLIPRLLAGSFGWGFPPLKVMTTHRHAAAIDPGYATSCPGDAGEEFYRRVAGAAFRHDPRPYV